MVDHDETFGQRSMRTRLTRRSLLRAGALTGASLAAMGLLAACGGDDDDDDDTATATPGSGTEATPTTGTGSEATATSGSGGEATATTGSGGEATATTATEPTATAGASGEIEQGGELIYALSNRIDTLDPTITTFSDSVRMAGHMFDPLVWQPEPGEFIPGLATSWEVAETADEYTFTLGADRRRDQVHL
jgi:ABC-type transport system substrate-binding protein